MQKLSNYIDGQLCPPDSGNYLDNYNPAEGAVYSVLPDSDVSDVNHAVEAAAAAFPAWAGMRVEKRSAILLRIADLIDRDREKLALAESIDNGKPISLARRLDIPRASANIRFFATGALHFSSEAHITGTEAVNYTSRAPLGVVGCISPWNLPLYLFTWKIAPALAAGCTVVAKPSELTPMTAFLFCQLCTEAGLPPGVLNVVHGLGQRVGQAIVDHPGILAISFTGGTVTGRKIAATTAPMFKKLSLELGGKNPNLVFGDCDFENAVTTTLDSSFLNQGEICLCGSRVLVEEPLYEKFLDELVRRTNDMIVGDPLEENTAVGALVSEAHLNKVLGYVSLAREEGGHVVAGGGRATVSGRCEKGYFMKPTIITGLHSQCRANQEEIFGPLITVMPFTSEEQAIAEANSTPYGLSATVWTENLRRAHRVAGALKTGIVWVNCWLLRDLRTPFGGVKQSGVGREGGWEAMRFFTETKNICVRL